MAKKKVGYVDGFVLVVKKSKIKMYRKMAAEGLKLWMKHGALDYKECMADDMMVGKIKRPFPKLVKPKPGEVVFFSFIGYASRTHRDAVNKKVMADPAMQNVDWQDKPMPFDMNKMAVGGFKVLVSN